MGQLRNVPQTATTRGPDPPVEADYIHGDPAEPGPIRDGTLSIKASGLVFSSPGEAELIIGIEDLEGITVSGSRVRGGGSDRRGTTRVAAYRDEQPAVLEFAVDRAKGVQLREHLNRERAGIGQPPLPFVEALYEFEITTAPPPAREHEDRPRKQSRRGQAPRSREREQASRELVVPLNGPVREKRRVYRQPSRQRQLMLALVAGIVALEIGVTLLVLFVF